MGHFLLGQRPADIGDPELPGHGRRQVASQFRHCAALLRQAVGEVRPGYRVGQCYTNPLPRGFGVEACAAHRDFGAHQHVERLAVGDAAFVHLPPELLDQRLGQGRNAAEIVDRRLPLLRRQGLHVEVVRHGGRAGRPAVADTIGQHRRLTRRLGHRREDAIQLVGMIVIGGDQSGQQLVEIGLGRFLSHGGQDPLQHLAVQALVLQHDAERLGQGHEPLSQALQPLGDALGHLAPLAAAGGCPILRSAACALAHALVCKRTKPIWHTPDACQWPPDSSQSHA